MILTHFQRSSLPRLALISKSWYSAVQRPLYHRPCIFGYDRLRLLIRTICTPVPRTTLGALSNKRISHLQIGIDVQTYLRVKRIRLTAKRMATIFGACSRFSTPALVFYIWRTLTLTRYNREMTIELSLINAHPDEEPGNLMIEFNVLPKLRLS